MPRPSKQPAAEVAAFLAACRHPLLAELQALRALVGKAAPTLVIFHRGAKRKDKRGKGRLLADDGGLLEWAADDRAIATFRSMAEIEAAKGKLAKVVKAWVALARNAPPTKREHQRPRDADAAPTPSPRQPGAVVFIRGSTPSYRGVGTDRRGRARGSPGPANRRTRRS